MPAEHQPQHVEVALDDEHALVASDALLGAIETVQHAPLDEQLRLGELRYFGSPGADRATAEADRVPARSAMGNMSRPRKRGRAPRRLRDAPAAPTSTCRSSSKPSACRCRRNASPSRGAKPRPKRSTASALTCAPSQVGACRGAFTAVAEQLAERIRRRRRASPRAARARRAVGRHASARLTHDHAELSPSYFTASTKSSPSRLRRKRDHVAAHATL